MQTGSGVAGDVHVGPAVVVEIAGEHGEAGGFRSLDSGALGHVGEPPTSVVVIERHGFGRQAHGAADHGEPFPHALPAIAGLGHAGGIEIEIVGDEQVQLAVAIVIEKGAAGAPALGRGQAACLRLIAKRAVALVMPEHVAAPGGDEQVDAAVVVDVAGTDALAPVVVSDAALRGYVFKAQSAEVVIEEVRGRGTGAIEPVRIDEEQVGKPVVVVIERGDAGARVLDDVHLLLVGAGDVHARQPGLRGQVFKPHLRSFEARREGLARKSGAAGADHLRKRAMCEAHDEQRRAERCQQRLHGFRTGAPAGSFTWSTRSASTFSSFCTMPLGQVISSRLATLSRPSPKWTRLSLDDW